MVINRDIEFEGKKISFQTGKLANQAQGSVLASMGETVVLATVVTAEPREGIDFFPLSVEYMERLYAGGRISSSRFIKREGRPASDEILKARLIDRSLRPLFPDDFRNEVQVVVTVLSYDKENDPAILGVSAASCAIMLAGLPFGGPVSAVQIGMLEDEFKANLNRLEQEESSLDLVVSSTKSSIVMIEAGAKEVPEERVIEGMEFGFQKANVLLNFQEEFVKESGVKVKEYKSFKINEELLNIVKTEAAEKIKKAIYTTDKEASKKILVEVKTSLEEKYLEQYTSSEISEAISYLSKDIARRGILERGERVDGRKLDQIRPLSIEVGVLPRTHGSGLFQRGETQVLSIVTLGSGSLEQITESIEGEGVKRYMHHYNFPGWSVGEVSRNLYYPGRREIGHGALAERALLPVIPSNEVFPYTIRVVSETLSSNGSTSMASTCGSTLALMDAGVPITAPVSGIAMGLIMNEQTGDYAILSDIQGLEDHFGDMDFKVTGTSKGVTAIQMDNKLTGISIEILKEALAQAKKGRMFILDKMLAVINNPRKDLSPYAPQISIIQINPKKIGDLIGPGGKVIKSIIKKTGADIDVDDNGVVSISTTDADKRDMAKKMIEDITQEVEVGRVYDAKVSKIMTFGVFVDISPSISGLVHVSEMSEGFVKNPASLVKEGQAVKVMATGVDEQGRANFSMKRVKETKKENK